MSVPGKERLGPRRFLRDRIRNTTCGIFRTIAFTFLPGFVTALSAAEGAVTCPERLSFYPTRPFTAMLAGECPLYARAIVIFKSSLNFSRSRAVTSLLSFAFPLFNLQTGAYGRS